MANMANPLGVTERLARLGRLATPERGPGVGGARPVTAGPLGSERTQVREHLSATEARKEQDAAPFSETYTLMVTINVARFLLHLRAPVLADMNFPH